MTDDRPYIERHIQWIDEQGNPSRLREHAYPTKTIRWIHLNGRWYVHSIEVDPSEVLDKPKQEPVPGWNLW